MREQGHAIKIDPERRERPILDAASRLSLVKGSQSISIGAVAQELEVAPSVVYACFDSRDELMSALLTREMQIILENMESALTARNDSYSPRQLLVNGFRGLLKAVARHADSWNIVLDAASDPSRSGDVDSVRNHIAARIGSCLRPMLVSFEVKEIERKLPQIVSFLMSMSEGAVRSMLRHEHDWTPDELGSFFGNTVFYFIKKI
ncbi:TetR/AcrR family transcriptional regulator [Burkholderia gladioli]|uniref:TetR/AcrR family transcriptional regulator n=1 Tax=Burkholderia gladioli TaxID=28095 RepID=UPI003B9823CF